MRLRDLRWYILASVIVIISYAAIAFCYYLPVRGRAEESMKVLGAEASRQEATLALERVNILYDSFIEDDSKFELAQASSGSQKYSFPSNGLDKKFSEYDFEKNERRILVAKASEFYDSAALPSNQTADNNYYFYFEKLPQNGEGYKFTKVLVDDVFKDAGKYPDENYYFQTYVLNDSEALLFDGSNNMQSSFSSLLGYSIEADRLDGYNQSNIWLKNSDGERVNGVFSIAKLGVKGYSTSLDIKGDIFVATFIDLTSEYLGINWVVEQAFMFYGIGVFVIIIMLVILILGCRKASVLLRVDRHALSNTKAIVIRVDENGKVIFTNKVFKQLYGVLKLENVNDFMDVITHENIMKTVKKSQAFECSVPLKKHIETDEEYDYREVEEEYIYLHLSPLHISRSYYLMGNNITLDYERRMHLEEMCGKNEITNQVNGFSLRNNFDHIIHDSPYDVAFVEYNIHHPEELITLFGRSSYNMLLNEILRVLKEVYEEDVIYHLDDSKFMVVCPNESLNIVAEMANKALDLFKRPILVRNHNIYVKMKIVTYNVKREDFATAKLDDIKAKQELALKNIAEFQTKDYIVYDPAMDIIIEAADEMEQDLERGLIDREFKMFLQPQFDVVMNKINGFEALIRWVNPKYRDKSPQAFIELAEQRGHMLDIGKFVISESFRLAKKLEPYNVHISINVSPIQILQQAFVQQLIDEFKANKLKKGSIALEITETFLMGNFQLVTEKLKLLKDMGFHIHLDDFCTGYSSMLYLKDLPCDTIKIDKEFTKYVETSKVHASIIRAICSLATSLDKELICEGVESQAQADIIKKMGCRTIQGYLIGKAVPFDEALELIKKYNE